MKPENFTVTHQICSLLIIVNMRLHFRRNVPCCHSCDRTLHVVTMCLELKQTCLFNHQNYITLASITCVHLWNCQLSNVELSTFKCFRMFATLDGHSSTFLIDVLTLKKIYVRIMENLFFLPCPTTTVDMMTFVQFVSLFCLGTPRLTDPSHQFFQYAYHCLQISCFRLHVL